MTAFWAVLGQKSDQGHTGVQLGSTRLAGWGPQSCRFLAAAAALLGVTDRATGEQSWPDFSMSGSRGDGSRCLRRCRRCRIAPTTSVCGLRFRCRYLLTIGRARTQDEYRSTQIEYCGTHRKSATSGASGGPQRPGQKEGERCTVGKLSLRTKFYLSARNHHMHIISR